VVHHRKPNVEFSYRDAARRGHRLSGANKVPIGNRSSHLRVPSNHFSRMHLDLQKDLIDNKRSSVLIVWSGQIYVNNSMISGILGFIIRKMLFYRWVPVVVLFKFKNQRESSPLLMLKTRILIWFQFVASACRLLFPSRPCKDWIKCFTCGAMGHVSRHCEAKWKKVHIVDLLPKQAVNQLSTTLERIRLAKSWWGL
jgi:hypothetical protein